MQRDPRNFTGNGYAHAYEAGGFAQDTPLGGHYTYGVSASPAFSVNLAGINPQLPSPLGGFELQPSENCPRNFIIFDQTDDKSRVMFHPAVVHKFSSVKNNVYPSQPDADRKSSSRTNNSQGNDNHDKYSSSFKEDTKDIDALLSSDEEGEDEEDDDVVSTGRTPNHWGSSSPGSSCSTKVLKHSMSSFSSAGNWTNNGSISNQDTRDRAKNMVTVLREIIPGGELLDTSAVLDEAVRYLKYLKMEVKKLGIQSFDD
ncbi:transcription factor bHLH144-like [Typha angustifolia]|uniref:transcription factor bHLH144-like n=1 Tax=Typha angustifolia TaxID=59011 RepID=UPI003C2AF3DD